MLVNLPVFGKNMYSLPTTIVDALPLGIIGLATVFLIAFWTIAVLRARHERRRERSQRAKLAQVERRESALRQQLQKPSFESRLASFSGRSDVNQQRPSKMPFWQAEDLELKYAPPKPIELIRTALIRLAKLFHRK